MCPLTQETQTLLFPFLNTHTHTHTHTQTGCSLAVLAQPNVTSLTTQSEREKGRVQSIAWLICFSSSSKNNINQSACGMLGEKEGFTYTHKHLSQHTHTHTKILCSNDLILKLVFVVCGVRLSLSLLPNNISYINPTHHYLQHKTMMHPFCDIHQTCHTPICYVRTNGTEVKIYTVLSVI